MKVISFLILCSLIIYINTLQCLSKDTASSSSDCKDLEVTLTGNHCCYIKASTEYAGAKIEVKRCTEITQTDYDNIDQAIKNAIEESEKAGMKISIDSLDCKSSYIVLSLFSLLLFLL